MGQHHNDIRSGGTQARHLPRHTLRHRVHLHLAANRLPTPKGEPNK